MLFPDISEERKLKISKESILAVEFGREERMKQLDRLVKICGYETE